MPELRTVIQEPRASKSLDAGIAEYPRLEDVFCGLEWRLARAPQDGLKYCTNKDIDYFLIKSDRLTYPGIPQLTALYRFNDHEVVIEGIFVRPQGEE